MGKANVDPVELKRFARDVQRFSAELEALMARMRGRMLSLEKTWQDQEQVKFFEEFEQAMKVLTKFVEISHEHSALLVKKARHIEDYLQQR